MDEGNIVLWVVTNREAVVVVSTGKFRGIKNVVIPGETRLPKDRLGDGVLRMIMNRKYGVAVQKEKKKDAERSRSTGTLSAAAEEGKFHVSVRVSQRAQIFWKRC